MRGPDGQPIAPPATPAGPSSQQADSLLESTADDDALTSIIFLFAAGHMQGQSWPTSWNNSIVVLPNVQQLSARGTVRIQSLDPFMQPLIDLKYMSSSYDLSRGVDAVRQARSVMSQPAFASLHLSEMAPGASVQSDADIETWISQTANTGFHEVGTCKMGASSDPTAVVDPTSMRVYGLKHVRVIDASVAPIALSANTQALAMMVAVQGADLIIAEARQMEKHRTQDEKVGHPRADSFIAEA